MKHLLEKTEQLGIKPRVEFIGQVNHGRELWTYFDAADVFVLSSRSEGTPKVLLEAMARGLPIIASNVSGVPTMLGNNERGLLFNDNDVTDLIDKINLMKNEATIRRKLCLNGLEFAKIHTVEYETGFMLEKVYEKWPEIKSP